MAITITAFNTNGDSTGIDVTAYLATFVSPNYSPVGFGYFSSSDTDFSGNQYATTEQENLIPDATKQPSSSNPAVGESRSTMSAPPRSSTCSPDSATTLLRPQASPS